MSFVTKNCLNCDKQFNAETREVNRGNGKFCSRSCSGKYKSKNTIKLTPNISCAWCQKKFYKSKSKFKSKSKLYFCSRAHKDEAQTLNGLKEIHLPHFGNGQSSYREIAFRIKPKICERCNYKENEAAIIIHHKDKNRTNNVIENLEVLCCNCHAIEHWSD